MKLSPVLMLLCTSLSLAQSPPPGPNQPPPPPPPPNGPPPGGFQPGPGQGPGPGAGLNPGGGPNQNSPQRPFVDMMRQRFNNGSGGGGGSGFGGGGGGGQIQGQGQPGGPGMEQLGDEDRKRIRGAMEKVWNQDEVKSARDAAAEAAKRYRDAIHQAALKTDPSLAPLLEKIKGNMERNPLGVPPGGAGAGYPGGGNQPGPQGPPNGPQGRPNGPQGPPNGPQGQPNGPQGPPNGPQGQPNGPQGPPNGPQGRPNQPQGPPNGPPNTPGTGPEAGSGRTAGRGDALRAFGLDPAELQKLSEEQRGKIREAFEKIMQNPDIKAARETMEKTEGEGKRDAFRKLREAVKTKAEKDYPELAKLMEAARAPRSEGQGRPGGGGRANPEAPPAAPPASGQAPPANTPGAPENSPPK